MKIKSLIGFFALCLLLMAVAGCSESEKRADLMAFMAKVKSKPKGRIDPVPKNERREKKQYKAASLRSPFDRPITVMEEVVDAEQPSLVPPPDMDRTKETLERFAVENLTMVGTIDYQETLYALVDDGEAGIHRVRPGNFLGRNYGKIIVITPDAISVVETVPDGQGGWVERPRTLVLKENE